MLTMEFAISPRPNGHEVDLCCVGDGPCKRLAADWQAVASRQWRLDVAVAWEPAVPFR